MKMPKGWENAKLLQIGAREFVRLIHGKEAAELTKDHPEDMALDFLKEMAEALDSICNGEPGSSEARNWAKAFKSLNNFKEWK